MRASIWLSVIAAAVLVVACDEPTDSSVGGEEPRLPVARSAMMMAADTSMGAESAQRMEVGRSYRVEVTEGSVKEALEIDRSACLKFECVIKSVSSAENTSYPNASLQALVPMAQADAFHDHIMGVAGRVIAKFNETAANREQSHQDLEARLERLEFMKKRLYQLADQKSKKVGDLLQVERELMRVETDIERLTRQRKGIEKVTDNVAFSLQYKLRPPKAGDVNFSPFQGLVSDSINMLFKGVRLTVLWIARWFPVMVLVGGAVWLIRRRRINHD
ncbi:MAG: DUF4349 domain-containing protein [Magnetovibrio sp.]|nr:DUF4349 domain-containing protein [Magnetovibrio sp.]